MATVNSTRQMWNELENVCTALEKMACWTGTQSNDVELVQLPILQRFRDVLEQGHDFCGPD